MLTKQEMDIRSYHSVSKCQELDREIQRPTKQRNTAKILKEVNKVNNSKKTVPMVKHSGGSTMPWGSFNVSGDGNLIIETGFVKILNKASSIQQQHWVWVVPWSSNRTITQNIYHSWWRTPSWRPKWKLLTGLSKPWLEPPWKSIVRSGGTGEICQRKKGSCCTGDICETCWKLQLKLQKRNTPDY